ncbi:MAG TPA: radical SAM protein [Myxococcota bacterium]|nr:radical SAM protein [Myxococcota bacterium]
MRRHTGFEVEAGSRVYVHQAFRCCPFAGMVTSQVHDYVELNGYEVVTDPAIAQVHVINSCGSDAEQSQLTYDAIQRVRRAAPDAPVVVTGCLASIEPKRLLAALSDAPHSALLDTRAMDGLDELFVHDRSKFEQVQPSLRNQYSGTEFSAGWYHVGVSTGCFGKCTFCAIRQATGRPRSSSIAKVLADVDHGVQGGQRDVLLVSTDVSAWGADLGLTVVDLLRAVADYPGEALFSAEAFEPTLFLEHLDALIPVLASGRFAFIGLPIQSGSQRILDQMRRPYRVGDVLDAVARLKRAAPDLVVRTDFMYGFGDETDDDFLESVEVSRAFDIPSWNAYQERPGTARRLVGEDVLSARRAAVMEELRRRSHLGWPQIRRMAPLDADVPTEFSSRPVEDEQERPEIEAGYARWMADLAQRFSRVVARKGPVTLAAGWSLASAVVHEQQQAVLITLRRGAASLDVGLRRADQPGSYMARSDRMAMWIVTPGLRLDEGQDRAVRALMSTLGLAPGG